MKINANNLTVLVACPDRDCSESDKPITVKYNKNSAGPIEVVSYYCSNCGYELVEVEELKAARALDAKHG